MYMQTRGGETAKGVLAIAVGLIALAAAYKLTPVLEILNLFFFIVLVPLGICCAFGLVGWGTFKTVQANTVGLIARVRNHMEVDFQEIVREQQAKAGAPASP